MAEIPGMLSPGERELVEAVLASHDYDGLTATQREALADGALSTENRLLVAETGNGKTLVGECRVRQTLHAGGRVAYLVPSHRLVKEKAAELRDSSPDGRRVTADPSDEADAVVRTFESFFRTVLYDPGRLDDLDLVVLDDFHEIYSDSRGPGIEKAITLLVEADVPLFAMSATIGNPAHVGEWLDAAVTVASERRGVPIEERPVAIDDGYQSRGAQIAALLEEHRDKAPFLVFSNSRRNCEARARAAAEAGVFDGAADRAFRAELGEMLDSGLPRRYRALADLLDAGVAYHHAGLDRAVQDYLTALVHDGAVTALYCTPTLAYGFDAPIQSVIVADLKRWTGDGMAYVGCYEYVQWIGRAGRPGYGYEQGYAFPMYKSLETAEEAFGFDRDATAKSLEPVRTHLDAREERQVFLLELIRAGWATPEELGAMLKASFYWTQLRISARTLDDWGMSQRDPTERITRELGSTAAWLSDKRLTEQRADGSFRATTLGDAMMQFVHDSWGQYPLAHCLGFLDLLRREEALEALELLRAVVDHFDKTLGETTDDEPFQAALRERGLGTDDVGQTVGLLAWYWCDGITVTDIERTLDLDAGYLPVLAHQLADLLDSIKRFFTPLGRAPPAYYDTLRQQLRYGVAAETVRLVAVVEGVGRARVASLQAGLLALEQQRDEDYGTGSLSARLTNFRDDALEGDRRLFRDVLGSRGPFAGVGPKIAQRIDAALPLDSPGGDARPFDPPPATCPGP